MPVNIDQPLEELVQCLRAVAEGATGQSPEEVFDRAFRAALSQGGQRQPDAWELTTTFTGTISDHIRQLRKEAGWTQAELADAMAQLGFRWRRVTVAEVETAGMAEAEELRRSPRRVNWEELLGLAALFGEPMVKFLLPKDNYLDFPTGEVSPEDVEELVIGKGGTVGDGGASWETAGRVCGDSIGGAEKRPAVALWRRRRTKIK